jgi:hypothetical protein
MSYAGEVKINAGLSISGERCRGDSGVDGMVLTTSNGVKSI